MSKGVKVAATSNQGNLSNVTTVGVVKPDVHAFTSVARLQLLSIINTLHKCLAHTSRALFRRCTLNTATLST